MKFSFIGQVAEEQRQLPPGVRFPVVFMCRMLEVTRQGYYEWKKRPVSAHDQKDAELAARIRYLHQERHPRVPNTRDLRHAGIDEAVT